MKQPAVNKLRKKKKQSVLQLPVRPQGGAAGHKLPLNVFPETFNFLRTTWWCSAGSKMFACDVHLSIISSIIINKSTNYFKLIQQFEASRRWETIVNEFERLTRFERQRTAHLRRLQSIHSSAVKPEARRDNNQRSSTCFMCDRRPWNTHTHTHRFKPESCSSPASKHHPSLSSRTSYASKTFLNFLFPPCFDSLTSLAASTEASFPLQSVREEETINKVRGWWMSVDWVGVHLAVKTWLMIRPALCRGRARR